MRVFATAVINAALRLIIRTIARIDTSDFASIPFEGPFIIVFNHVNFLELPLLYLKLQPRKVHYLAKRETWKKPFLGWMADNWGTIPVDRGTNPSEAFWEAGSLLKKGHILLMSPEGTRSEDGILRRGRAGAIILALQYGVPILTVGHWGARAVPV